MLWFRALAVLMALAWFAPWAVADGKVFARRQVVTTIPDQEALIQFKDGVQTLAIQTRFTASDSAAAQSAVGPQDAAFAWVVPVPGHGGPPEVSATTPGAFTTLRAISQPRVVSRSAGYWLPAVLLSAIFVIPCCIRLRSFGSWLLAAIGLLFVLICLLPALGTARASAGGSVSADGVAVLAQSRVGSFDVTTIGADPGAPADGAGKRLGAWLSDHGFDLPEGVEPVLADYAKRGWVFVASRLRSPDSDSGRRLSPHPLVFKFKTPEPVYPLMLTGTGGTPLAVDLYVFGRGLAQSAGFTAARCAAAEFQPDPDRHVNQWRFIGGRPTIAHDELRRLVPASCTLTRLSGTLTPEQMKSDATIRFEPASEIGSVVYSHAGAIGTGADQGSLVLLVGSLVLALLVAATRAPAGQGRRGAVMVLGIAAAVGAAVYIRLPKAKTEKMLSISRLYSAAWEAADQVAADLARAQRSEPGFAPTADWVRDRMAAQMPAVFRSVLDTEFAGFPRDEDSPFNYRVREGEKPGTFEVVWHDAAGVAQERPLAVIPPADDTDRARRR